MERIATIGFGEAARTFAAGGLPVAAAFDIDPAKRTGVAEHDSAAIALADSTLVLSLVTADQALAAARAYSGLLAPDAVWCDLNSVAPDTKRAAADVISCAGGRYVDVAVMAPVEPGRLAVPLLLSGPHADNAAHRLRTVGFTNVRAIGDRIGAAAAVKMIRSVMIKGTEALTAEMMLAARAAGVEAEVLGSLGEGWDTRAAYNLERMTAHGARRAAEMEEAAKTLAALGVDPVMTRGTVIRQRAMAATRMEQAA